MMHLHTTVIRVMDKHMDTPDWREICDEQEARPYPLRHVLGQRDNVSHRLRKVDWRGVAYGFYLLVAGLLIAGLALALGVM